MRDPLCRRALPRRGAQGESRDAGPAASAGVALDEGGAMPPPTRAAGDRGKVRDAAGSRQRRRHRCAARAHAPRAVDAGDAGDAGDGPWALRTRLPRTVRPARQGPTAAPASSRTGHAFEARSREIQAHREAVARRNAERAARGQGRRTAAATTGRVGAALKPHRQPLANRWSRRAPARATGCRRRPVRAGAPCSPASRPPRAAAAHARSRRSRAG